MAPPTSLYLPPEVVFSILSHLPVKSLFRFKAVCKSWLRLISDPHFVAAHIEQSKKRPRILLLVRKYHDDADSDTLSCYDEEHQNYARLLPVESWHRLNPHHCDGLVMIYSEMNIFVCNPCTGERVRLHRSHHSDICPGFGFDPSTNRHKVVRLFETETSGFSTRSTLKCEVFTLRSDRAWRTVAFPPDCSVLYGHDAATVNGVVYWLSKVRHGPQRRQQDQEQVQVQVQEQWQLLAFDLRDESFRVIQIPYLHEFDNWRRLFLINDDGRLCLILVSWSSPLREVWVLNAVDDEWSMRYCFECEQLQYYFLCPVPVILPGERVLFNWRGLYFYDTRRRRLGTVALKDDAHYFFSFAVYSESMLSVGPGPGPDPGPSPGPASNEKKDQRTGKRNYVAERILRCMGVM